MDDRILIVDDEEMICSLLARRLTQEGYCCLTANNGEEALARFHKGDLSLIISDLIMPEMGGMELLKIVKALNSNMMVIIMTAYPEIDLSVEAMRLGAYDFIIKPAHLDLVVSSVKKALEKKRLVEELDAYHHRLERLVEERTAKLQEAYHVLSKAHLDSVRVLVEAIDAKDPYTMGHSDRVRKMCMRIGLKLKFGSERLQSLEYGALLHDIGKIGIKDEVLQKQSLLHPGDYLKIREHPLIGAKIVGGIDFFRDKIPMIRHHHEHFDGSGYPDGLAGEAIPLEARIISIPDAFDAMTSARNHRVALGLQDALTEFEKEKGKQFDPHILGIFLSEKIYHSSNVT